MAEKPSNEEIQAALRVVADATPGRPGSYNRALRDLARYREWAETELELAATQEKHLSLQLAAAHADRSAIEFVRRLKAKDAELAELRREIQRLTTNLVDHRKRDITKGAELAQLRQENENLHNSLRDAGVAPRLQWSPEPVTQENLEAQIAALSGPETPKGKSYADAELGVIQDCLEALERVPSTQRAAVTQYLTSRAHSASWGAMPQPW